MNLKTDSGKNDSSIFTSFVRRSKVIGQLFTFREKKVLVAISLLSVFLGLLDLIGVALVGVIGSLAVVNFGNGTTGSRVSALIEFLNFDKLDLSIQITLLCLMTATFLASKSILSLVFTRRSLSFLSRISATLSSDLITRFFAQSIVGLRKRNTQETIYSLTSGVQTLTVGVVGTSVSLFADVWLLSILSAGLFFVSPATTILSFFTLSLLSVVLYRNSQKKVKETAKAQARLEIASAQNIQNLIHVYKELLVSNRRSFFIKKIVELRYLIAAGQAKLQFFAVLPKFTLEFALVVFSVTLGIYQFSINTPTRAIATVAIFLVASLRIIPAITRLQHGIFTIKTNYAKSALTLEVIGEMQETKLSEGKACNPTTFGKFEPSISVSNLFFSYEGKRNLIRGVNLEIRPGESVAIWGESGQGKSTLIDLLLGVLTPKSGKITISGQQPRDAFSIWPNSVSYVSQNAPLIDGTFRDNLTLGICSDEFSDEKLWSVLEKTNLKSYVKGLEKELDTSIGELGSKLSGGQRQRLAISRALLINPQLLILDEAVNALDSRNKSLVMRSITKLNEGVTVLMVTHDQQLARYFDTIYGLNKGALKKVKGKLAARQ